ncbi:Hsp70 protein that interacts with Zuo1p [Coemansia sp. RSA 2523]|nr:Hsp70 protein that interacts with Zuo1p [Coemansia sp. RSA 1752]KAJ1777252.1 Hsp70 protein that interacts with Zuo1p [Coemansia sp. RSA 1824]KAJ1785244.1 Hsp70 protein that interacts with Zuo1p [Coemansia sp. RSA 2167]KAJ1790223.1 Hsp70 protein that interacts with Zuo1p [Coemansia sp. RSA 1938]KAJ1807318.1 Hsp70 protein that interacts with Zuo1p [Coemansia sp. RSA 2523]KAJ2201477.1 Hsp70 protein that interacts with Zuo1p [Coemansia sp. RSA 522]KAJ2231740.1 Hsp70 protein that interacts with
MATKTYIGLSLGTDNSVIAIINKEHGAEVIANEDGEHKTPTYIAFSGDEEYHGSQAKHQLVRNAESTLQGFVGMLGTEYSAELAAAHQGYARVEDGPRGAEFVVATESGEVRLTAHEATVRYLGRLRTTAEAYLGRTIEGAVLGVPMSRTSAQRAAIAQACAEAGLPLLQLVDEPVAAAMQYGVGQTARDETVLVVDVGGSGADVAVVVSTGGLVTVAGSAHTSEVSGKHLDMVLAKHFAGEFQKQGGPDVLEQTHGKPMRKLLQAVEVTKRTLSAAPTAPCAVESLAGGMDYNGTITRTRFDILANKAYAPLEAAIEQALEAAGYSTEQIDQVLLCGGAARVRKLQTRVALMFPESTQVRSEGELDEVVASGCAAQASLLAQSAEPAQAAVSAQVLNAPVGLRVSSERMEPVLLKNTPLPAKRTVKVVLPAGETRAYIAVSEGESVPKAEVDEDEDEDEESGDEDDEEPPRYRPSRLLAEMILELDEATDATRVEVSFFVGTDGKLTVTATEPVSGKTITAEIPASN